MNEDGVKVLRLDAEREFVGALDDVLVLRELVRDNECDFVDVVLVRVTLWVLVPVRSVVGRVEVMLSCEEERAGVQT